MTSSDYDRVRSEMRLADGTLWPIQPKRNPTPSSRYIRAQFELDCRGRRWNGLPVERYR